MMSYRLKIDPKSRKVASFISQLQRKIQEELVESGLSQQEVATILQVDRSVVNRRLKGSANLTARSIAEFAYAFGKEIDIDFVDGKASSNTNYSNNDRADVLLGGSVGEKENTHFAPSGQIEMGAL